MPSKQGSNSSGKITNKIGFQMALAAPPHAPVCRLRHTASLTHTSSTPCLSFPWPMSHDSDISHMPGSSFLSSIPKLHSCSQILCRFWPCHTLPGISGLHDAFRIKSLIFTKPALWRGQCGALLLICYVVLPAPPSYISFCVTLCIRRRLSPTFSYPSSQKETRLEDLEKTKKYMAF